MSAQEVLRKPGMVRARELLSRAARKRRGSTAGSATGSVSPEALLDVNATTQSEKQIKVRPMYLGSKAE